MLKFAIIGIGNAGNQVANIAVREGIASFCINTSRKDLDTIDKSIEAYIIGSAEGAGKDRNVAKRYVKQYFRDLLSSESFTNLIDDKDVVFIISSTGGGTGSGCSIILTDILSKVYTNKIFIPIGILPLLSEAIGTQRNTVEYLKELQALDKPYMLYDNNNYKTMHTNDCMDAVNYNILRDILVLRGDYCYQTQYGMIDDADMLKIISLPGMINVTFSQGFREKDIDEDDKLDTFVIDNMKNNASVSLDKDRIIKRLGVILNLTENMVKYYDSELNKLRSVIGEPIESFEHFYVIQEDEPIVNSISTIASGLSIPDDRIEAIVDKINEASRSLKKAKTSSILDNIDFDDSLKISINGIDRDRTSEKNDINSLDFDLDKY